MQTSPHLQQLQNVQEPALFPQSQQQQPLEQPWQPPEQLGCHCFPADGWSGLLHQYCENVLDLAPAEEQLVTVGVLKQFYKEVSQPTLESLHSIPGYMCEWIKAHLPAGVITDYDIIEGMGGLD